ncbi:MAG: S8 family serine peptidase, partial [Pseudomonadota bacterium]
MNYWNGFTQALLLVASLALATPPVATAQESDLEVLVSYKTELNYAQVERITALGASVLRDFDGMRMRKVVVPADKLNELRSLPDVRFVAKDRPIESHSTGQVVTLRSTMTHSKSDSRATYLRAQRVHSTIGVAVVDSGVANHTDLDVKARLDCFWGSNALSVVSTTPCVSAIDNDVTGTFSDNFESEAYRNSDGSSSWLGDAWIESGDDNSPDGGRIKIRSNSSSCFNNGVYRNEDDDDDDDDDGRARGSCLVMSEADDGDWVGREINLKKAATAWLTFDYKASFDEDDGAFVLDMSTDGGRSWINNVAVYDRDESLLGEAIDLTPYLSGETMFRFRVSADDDTEDMKFVVDNLSIAVEGYDSYDPFGHGTHVAGMIASTGAAS